MQQKSAVECSHGERLKKLRAILQVEWEELALRLKVSPSTCYQVARGTKSFGDLALFRLEEAEREAGLAPPAEAVLEVAVREDRPQWHAGPRDDKKKKFLDIEKKLAQIEALVAEIRTEITEEARQ